MTYDLIIRNGMVATPGGLVATDVGVIGQRIAQIGDLTTESAGQVVDAKGLHVLPGCIDSQVHFREPGVEYKEDLESGGNAAVLGGITAVFEMPNTNPSTTTADALIDKLNRAKGRMQCDHAFYIGATPDNIENLPEIERLPGCCGVKAFLGSSTGSLLLSEEKALTRLLSSIQRRAAFHSEEESRLKERKSLARAGDWTSHPEVRDVESALMCTKKLIRIARAAGKRVHVLHVTTAEEMAFLAHHKDVATVEVTPQHLTLFAPDCYETLKGRAQMNPPIREAYHRAGLWDGVAQGVVDVIGSDHAPHTLAEKEQPYPASPSGMPGVQTLLPIMLTHVAEGRLSLDRLIDLICAGPARIFGLSRKGRIARGMDADFTLIDLAARRIIRDDDQASKVGWTPFDGMEAKGWPMMTIIRGHIVMRDGEITGKAMGEPLVFQDALVRA